VLELALLHQLVEVRSHTQQVDLVAVLMRLLVHQHKEQQEQQIEVSVVAVVLVALSMVVLVALV
jgi:hypothetical protein